MSNLPNLISLGDFHTLGEREKMFLEVFSIGGFSTLRDHLPRTMNLSEFGPIVASVVIVSPESQFHNDLIPKNTYTPVSHDEMRSFISKMYEMLGVHDGWQLSINAAVGLMAGLDGEKAVLSYHESEGVLGVFGTLYGFYLIRAGHPLAADPNALDIPSTPKTKH